MFGLKKRNEDAVSERGIVSDHSNTFAKLDSNSAVVVHVTGKFVMELLPEGVILKRVFSRNGGSNKWMVRLHNTKTEYYAPSIDEALEKFFRNHPKQLVKYNANSVDEQ